MKFRSNNLLIELAAIIALTFLFISCQEGMDPLKKGNPESFEIELQIGDLGQALGYVFYENPNYATDGWRYLEVAYDQLRIPGYTEDFLIFGEYQPEGTETVSVGTSTEVGTGEANTKALVAAMGEAEYDSDNRIWRGMYAAKACDDYAYSIGSLGGYYDDWFLPSRDELILMYRNLAYLNDFVSFPSDFYWSSSETFGNYAEAVAFFGAGVPFPTLRNTEARVRPIRAF